MLDLLLGDGASLIGDASKIVHYVAKALQADCNFACDLSPVGNSTYGCVAALKTLHVKYQYQDSCFASPYDLVVIHT